MDEDICTICYENLDPTDRFVTEECGHQFGKSCMAEYIDEAKKDNERLYHETDDELRPQLDMVCLDFSYLTSYNGTITERPLPCLSHFSE